MVNTSGLNVCVCVCVCVWVCVQSLGCVGSDLDSRFDMIRTCETTMGNFVADILMITMNADVCIINSGAFRSDQASLPSLS